MANTILVATRKGLFTVERSSGGDWRVARAAFVGDRVSLALADGSDGPWYAALDHGHFGVKMHRSEDRGETWPEVAAPAYPPKPEGRSDTDGGGREIDWTTKMIWALAAGADGTLWCGTLPGGVFTSTDRGDSWSLNEALWEMPERGEWFGGGADTPGVHSICVDPRDPKRVLAGVSCGGVWLTEDGGTSWENRAEGMRAEYMPPERATDENIQDPHLIVQCPSSPDCYWAQHHNGIFRSTDNATTWTELTDVPPSSFGFATAVHPGDPDTAWFVPAVKDEHRLPVGAQLIVNRTRDGGASFEALREGLPQEHAYDLVYRHALDIDESGDALAFGSTTGNLWVTENQGDSWSCVSHHLPPVYAVRFVRGG